MSYHVRKTINHECELPNIYENKLGSGTLWMCDECSEKWGVFSNYSAMGLDWEEAHW